LSIYENEKEKLILSTGLNVIEAMFGISWSVFHGKPFPA
jgi:hypothetical protein